MNTLDEAMEGTKLQRFAPDLGLFVTWSGGATFSVWSYHGSECSEVDAFTVYGDDKGNPPTFDQAVAAIDRHFADGRHCAECGADILGNDPHEPGCSEEVAS